VARAVAWDDTNSDVLYMKEVLQALEGAKQGIQERLHTALKIDVVGFDACVMGMVEVAYALRMWRISWSLNISTCPRGLTQSCRSAVDPAQPQRLGQTYCPKVCRFISQRFKNNSVGGGPRQSSFLKLPN
jgi:hypothetical protein